MKILLLFPFYKECQIYFEICEQVKSYKGEHKFIIKKAQGTIVHDVRNVLIAETLRISKQWKLTEFDFAVMFDSDVDATLENAIYLAESGKDIIGLPYALRGSEHLYNSGFILRNRFDHLPIETTGMMEVHGQGNGCKGWTRIVFETIKPYWFWPEIHIFEDGSIDSLVEDWAFDKKAREAGFRVWCDFDHPVKHKLKESKMSTDLGKLQRKSQLFLNEISGFINNLVEMCESKDAALVKLKQESDAEILNLKTEIEKLKQDILAKEEKIE